MSLAASGNLCFSCRGSHVNPSLVSVGDIIMTTQSKWEATLSVLTCVLRWQIGDALIIAIACGDATFTCQTMSIFPSFFFSFLRNGLHLLPCSNYHHSLASRITPVLTCDPHNSTLSQVKNSAVGGGKDNSKTLQRSLSLFPYTLLSSPSMRVCARAQAGFISSWKLLCPKQTGSIFISHWSAWAHTEEKKKRLLSPTKISRVALMDSQRNWPLV